jgi:hypothetical protein
MKIGIFSRYKEKDRFKNYHCSPCKIFKIIDELNKFIEFDYSLNDYKDQYDFAIVDRIKPAKNIKSRHILGIFETRIKGGWATDFCSVSPAIKNSGPKHFHLLNYCHGRHLDPKLLSRKRSRGVYIGRLSDPSEFKIKLLNNSNFNFDIFPIKYWKGKEVLRFHDGSKESGKNISFLQSKFPKSKILRPVNHDGLYHALNQNGYSYGFVPSVYGLGSRRMQVESSSKFFEYIGAGIPVLIESNVPEAKIVINNPFLGEVFSGRKDMLKKAAAMERRGYDYFKILSFAQKYHYPYNRAEKIYNHFIKSRL